MADAKIVDLYAPAGVQLNYRGVTGYTHAVVMPHTLILKAIERGCVVRELKDDGSFVELTKENYASSNGGSEVPEDAVIPQDEEDLDLEYQKSVRKAYMDEVAKQLDEESNDPPKASDTDLGGEVTVENTAQSTMLDSSTDLKSVNFNQVLPAEIKLDKTESNSDLAGSTNIDDQTSSTNLDSSVNVQESSVESTYTLKNKSILDPIDVKDTEDVGSSELKSSLLKNNLSYKTKSNKRK